MCVGFLVLGCSSSIPAGALVTAVRLPVSGNGAKYSKEGHSACVSIFGLIAVGDCSIETAAKEGGIHNIKVVDRRVVNVLGIFGHYETIVKGD